MTPVVQMGNLWLRDKKDAGTRPHVSTVQALALAMFCLVESGLESTQQDRGQKLGLQRPEDMVA